jgi:hypothetical protein
MSGEPFAAFLPLTVRPDGSSAPLAVPFSVPGDDLFGSIDGFVRARLRDPSPRSHGLATSRAAFVMAPHLAITVDLESVRPSHVQCLLALLARRGQAGVGSEVEGHVLDPECGLTLWSAEGTAAVEAVDMAWREIAAAGQVEPLVALTTPWLYGNKLRLTRFVTAVATTALPAGAPVMDLMSGTGIIARTLSDRHPVSTNDPNPYAALLSRCQGLAGVAIDARALTAALQPAYAENQSHLERLVGGRLEEEGAFLHAEPTADVMERYAHFTSAAILPITDGMGLPAACLATERYANVYFGLAQAMEVDSLRIAIERVFPTAGVERDLCLCALVLACTTCATGPHFAQPARAQSLTAFRTIVERRARSVAWEFDLALGRLVARRPPATPMGQTTQLNWRDALLSFVDGAGGGPAGVYVDPPYSKLQYSRYYHVLNVLLAYDYPATEGVGRYPPKDQRFSSRFEYQPRVAQRELIELIRACAQRGLTSLISYGDGGFAGIDALAKEMVVLFSRVEIFSEELRHHSQGRRLDRSRGNVLEYLLVGHPSEERLTYL